MTPAHIEQLRATFRETHPEYAKFFDRAKSQREVEHLQELFLHQARSRLATLLGKAVEELDDHDQTSVIAFSPDEVQSLLSASGGDIEGLIHKYLDALQRLKDMTNDNSYQVAAEVLGMGAFAIGATAISAATSTIIQGGTLAAAALFGVSTATVGVVCAIAAIVVLLVVIPIIYYMEKPALCMVLLLNKLVNEKDPGETSLYALNFKDDHNVHGKPVLMTTPIDSGIDFGPGQLYLYGGFVATNKRDNALVGSQYGFTYNVGKSDSPGISFGVEDPLIFGGNKGYCAVGSNSSSAADAVDSSGNLDYSAQGSGYALRIQCSSASGSIAYYIAIVDKT